MHVDALSINKLSCLCLQDSSWKTLHKPLHILDVIYSLLRSYVSASSSVIGHERLGYVTCMHVYAS